MGCTCHAHYYVCGQRLVTESKIFIAGRLASESFRAVPLQGVPA